MARQRLCAGLIGRPAGNGSVVDGAWQEACGRLESDGVERERLEFVALGAVAVAERPVERNVGRIGVDLAAEGERLARLRLLTPRERFAFGRIYERERT